MFLKPLLANAAVRKGYMINHKSASKMHGVSAIFVPNKIYSLVFLFFFFISVSEVKVLECNNSILETALHAILFIVSIMTSTENTFFLNLFLALWSCFCHSRKFFSLKVSLKFSFSSVCTSSSALFFHSKYRSTWTTAPVGG